MVGYRSTCSSSSRRQRQRAAVRCGALPARQALRPSCLAALAHCGQTQPLNLHLGPHLLSRPVQEGAPVEAISPQDRMLHQAGLIPLLSRVEYQAAPPRPAQDESSAQARGAAACAPGMLLLRGPRPRAAAGCD
jgi:hypothetical protein